MTKMYVKVEGNLTYPSSSRMATVHVGGCALGAIDNRTSLAMINAYSVFTSCC